MNQHYLQLYADFIVKVGVNVQPRQNFIIRCPVTMPEFGHACVKAGYEAGAKNCIVRWEDDKLSRLHYEYAKEEDLAAMKPYELRSYLDYAEDPDGCCTLAIHAADPEALAGLDAAKINRVNLARRKFLKPWQEYTMNDRVQWCVAAVPAPSWAAKVFPGIPVEEAMEKLWALIFDVCRVSTGDPVSAWKAHVAEGRRHRDQLNAWNLDHIHMTSSNGTDLTVGLADDATWEGASSKAENGTDFIANVPTEEVFCAPHRERVNGIVYGTKPYVYNGQLIEGWHVTFKDGKVVEHGAEKNASLLAELLSTDENACRIGEIDGKKVGVIGQIHPLVAETYGIGAEVYAAELDFTLLQSMAGGERVFHPLPKFPAVARDLALVCDESLTVGELESCITAAAGKLLRKINLFDIYRGVGIEPGKKSVAFSLELRADDRTLTDEDSVGVVNKVLEKLEAELHVKLR